eukprot:COSAG04_NODE_2824_length_3532_cov_1.608506_4_plen_297_part_00
MPVFQPSSGVHSLTVLFIDCVLFAQVSCASLPEMGLGAQDPLTALKIGYSCTQSSCRLPPPADGRWVGSVATYSCDSGALGGGDATRTCLADGTWGGAAPACHHVRRQPLCGQEHNSHTKGQTRRECAHLILYPSHSLDTLFAFAQVSCASLPAVDGIAISYSDDQWAGSVATYSCTAADLVPGDGDGTRTCLADGSWGGAAPTSCVVRPSRAPPRKSVSAFCTISFLADCSPNLRFWTRCPKRSQRDAKRVEHLSLRWGLVFVCVLIQWTFWRILEFGFCDGKLRWGNLRMCFCA